VSDALQQRVRQRTQARSDLDEVFTRLRIQRSDDPLDVVPIDQEVLAEAFARDVALRRSCALRRATTSSRG
jgi:hypothetical protein